MPHDRYSKRPRKSEPVRNAGLQICSRSRASVPSVHRRQTLKRPLRMSSSPVRDRSTLRARRRSIRKDRVCLNASDSSMSDVSDFPDSSSRSRYYSSKEIKKAKERMEMYKLRSDPKISEQLLRECDADKRRYLEKVKSRDPSRSEDDFITGLEELIRRQRDIDRGKSSDIYQQYVNAVAKVDREAYHPRTPNKFRKVSRRAWDGMVKKWRLTLHRFETLNADEPYKTDASTEDEASDSVFTSPWTAHRPPVETEEETLQSGSKQAATAAATDDDTLDGNETQLTLRGRRVLVPSNQCAPFPDELHSGLSNDINVMTLAKTQNDSRACFAPATKRRKPSR